jgi:5'-3' exonuclease
MNNILILIDTSYTAFYRFFATIKWFSFAYKDEYNLIKLDSLYDWSLNKIFIEKYEKMFLESIIKILKKKVFNNSKIIFCLDYTKESLWRTEIDCTYKNNRHILENKYNFKQVFKYTYDYIIPNIINTYSNINIFTINNIEADDIIGGICLYFKSYNPLQKIYIISSDKDFLQLGRDNITFINYKNKKFINISEDEAQLLLKKKILFGDKSDCIKSIIVKNTKIKKNDLLDDNILNHYLNKYPEAKANYIKNRLMIDFTYIPNHFLLQIKTLIYKYIIKTL